MYCRIMEIDIAPRGIPDDVDKLIGPTLKDLHAKNPDVEMKAGELTSSNHVSHSSYFIGLWAADEHAGAAAAMADAITRYCNKQRLPIIEVSTNHAEYNRILDGFQVCISKM